MARGKQTRRILRIWKLLLDGRSKTLDAFDKIRVEENVHRRTIRRDLEVLTDIAEYEVVCYQMRTRDEEEKTYWRYEGKLIPEFAAPETKKCSHCSEKLPIARFHKNRNSSDGHTAQCIDCRRQRNQDWRNSNREHYNEWARKRLAKKKPHINELRRKRWAARKDVVNKRRREEHALKRQSEDHQSRVVQS